MRRKETVSTPNRHQRKNIGDSTVKLFVVVAVWTASTAPALPLAALAHADVLPGFQSPSGNIACSMRIGSDGKGSVTCEIRDHTWVIVAPTPNCGSHSGDWQFSLDEGNEPGLGYSCAAGTLSRPGLPTLDYGQTRSAGAITCDSEPSNMTCTDSSTGHFLRVSRDSYELG
jgi:hypothetical protein